MDSRKRGALNVLTVSCADALLLQAYQYLLGNDPRTLLPAAILLSGARPIGFIKTNKFSTSLHQQQAYPEFWARQVKFAKKGAHKATYNASRTVVFSARTICMSALNGSAEPTGRRSVSATSKSAASIRVNSTNSSRKRSRNCRGSTRDSAEGCSPP